MIGAIVFRFAVWQAEYDVLVYVLRVSCAFVAVALAARLYAHWQRPAADGLDTKRFRVLCLIVAALGLLGAVDGAWISALLMQGLPAEGQSSPSPATWIVVPAQYFWSHTIAAVGPVFLFGALAIAWMRWTKIEASYLLVAATALTTAFAYALIEYGAQFFFFVSDEFESLLLARMFIPRLSAVVLTLLCGAALYVASVDDAFVRRIVARVRALRAAAGSVVNDLPSTVRKLRSWPYRPTEDQER